MLILYYKPTCPFCLRVLKFAEENNISFDLRDTAGNSSLAQELIDRGGKRQTPYLVDEEKGTSMYESRDIIDYLTKNYVH